MSDHGGYSPNHHPHGAGYPAPPQPGRRQRKRKSPAFVALATVGITVFLGGIAGTLLLFSHGWIKSVTDPLVLPAVGQCTDASGLVLQGPLEVVDCGEPTATTKVVISETSDEADCAAGQIRILTFGYRDGDHVTAHSCGAPNLTIGNCYTKTGMTFVYDPYCLSSSVRLARQVPGTVDVEKCKSAAPDEPASRPRWGSSYDYADAANGVVNCFLPVG
ncbi:hypothetical protein [Nocardia bhagyanarayanae]|uniref:Uncharacterized protein n=1 Tax=Nocardia bhagyanarayanae TaxID=1215925 RepID=A0A543F3Q5_9NOCA|nr:hypothetical protein [Nocardia bhagyanarayanae]TQM28457.1 hypothetical protein FB390_0021 [Nocardia bhagyanarayanae]